MGVCCPCGRVVTIVKGCFGEEVGGAQYLIEVVIGGAEGELAWGAAAGDGGGVSLAL